MKVGAGNVAPEHGYAMLQLLSDQHLYSCNGKAEGFGGFVASKLEKSNPLLGCNGKSKGWGRLYGS